MNDIFTFIQEGLNNFTDGGNIYCTDLKDDCIKLNELLNKVNNADYEKHLSPDTIARIESRANILFEKMKFDTYANLKEVFNLLLQYQVNREIKDPHDPEKDIRDHYFHSLQCFLLALSLYPTLSKRYNQQHEQSSLVRILFSLCMYHDIGYLYIVPDEKEHKLNDSMNDLLFRDNEFFNVIILDMLSIDLRNMEYHEESGIKQVLDKIKNSSGVKNIWKKTLGNEDVNFLYNITGILKFPDDYENHHSFMSAVFLERILRTKRTIRQLLGRESSPGVISINPEVEQEKDFHAIIKSILLHDFEMSPPISLRKDFWSSFLIIIDELQTYGRLPQDAKKGKSVLNPKDVGFQWKNNNLQLTPVCFLNMRHNNKKIVKSLKNKIDIESLVFLT